METSVVYRVVNNGVQIVVQHNIITTVYCPSLIPSVLSSGGLSNNTVDERPKSESDSKVGGSSLLVFHKYLVGWTPVFASLHP